MSYIILAGSWWSWQWKLSYRKDMHKISECSDQDSASEMDVKRVYTHIRLNTW